MLSASPSRTKSLLFAKRIVAVYHHLCDNKNEYTLSKQLLRCGTSIGANLAESQYASSRKDFLNKVYIALKECAETLYWLELLHACNYLTDAEYRSLYTDCTELRKILSSITKTVKLSPAAQISDNGNS